MKRGQRVPEEVKTKMRATLAARSAEDRTAGELRESWAEPATGDELISFWDERDHRYGQRKDRGLPSPLTPNEIASIRAARKADIERLPAPEQLLPWKALRRGSETH